MTRFQTRLIKFPHSPKDSGERERITYCSINSLNVRKRSDKNTKKIN